jgi:MFS family permease
VQPAFEGSSVPAAHSDRILTRPFVLAVAAQHLYFGAFYSTITGLPLFLADLPSWQPGAIIGVMGLSSIVAGPLSGFAADRLGRRRTAFVGGVLTTLVFAVQGLSLNFWFLVAVRLVHGFVMQFFATANVTLTADVAPPARRGEAMGIAALSNTAAQIYAPWAALIIASMAGFQVYWVLTAALTGAASLLCLVIPEAYRPSEHEKGPLVSRSAVLPFLVFTGFTTGYGALTAFLTPWARAGLGDAGLWFVFFGVAMLVVRVNAGRMADRFGRVRVIVPGAVIAGAGYLLLSVPQTWAFYLATIPIGVGFAAAQTSLTALTIDRAGPSERGAAMGLFFLAWGAGQGIGALGLSPLAGAEGGSGAIFAICAVASLVAVIPLLLARRGATPAPASPLAVAVLAPPAASTLSPKPGRTSLFAAVSVGAWAAMMAYLTWFGWLRPGRRT